MKRVLILAGTPVGSLDNSATEVARAVMDVRGAGAATAVGAMELTSASWSHPVVGGRVSTVVALHDGRTIDSREVGAVLNLVRCPEPLLIHFLRSFDCRVLNGIETGAGRNRWSATRWATLAERCGLEVGLGGVATGTRLLWQRGTTPSRVVVVGDRVFGAESPVHARRCRRLARLAGCELLGLTFADDADAGAHGAGATGDLVSADPFPPLAGEVAEAVARLLGERAEVADDRAPDGRDRQKPRPGPRPVTTRQLSVSSVAG